MFLLKLLGRCLEKEGIVLLELVFEFLVQLGQIKSFGFGEMITEYVPGCLEQPRNAAHDCAGLTWIIIQINSRSVIRCESRVNMK